METGNNRVPAAASELDISDRLSLFIDQGQPELVWLCDESGHQEGLTCKQHFPTWTEVKEWLAKLEIQEDRLSQVIFMAREQEYLFQPSVLLNEQPLPSQSRFRSIFRQIPHEKALMRFELDAAMCDTLFFQFPWMKMVHSTEVLLHLAGAYTEKAVLTHHHKDWLTVVVSRNGKLIFLNRFQASVTDECLYYMAAVLHALDMEPETLGLYWISETPELAMELPALQQYFPHITELAPGRETRAFFRQKALECV
jgi:hypothetical protein